MESGGNQTEGQGGAPAEGTAERALNSIKKVLRRAEGETHRALSRAAPTVQKSVDVSMEAVSNGFTAAMKTIDSATAEDQAKLLRAYAKLVDGQSQFVHSRIAALEEKKKAASGGAPAKAPEAPEQGTHP